MSPLHHLKHAIDELKDARNQAKVAKNTTIFCRADSRLSVLIAEYDKRTGNASSQKETPARP